MAAFSPIWDAIPRADAHQMARMSPPAAIIAMVGLGYLKDFSEAKRFVKTEATYTPNPASKKVYDKLFEDYKRIYYSLEKAYKLANGARFSESEE